MKLKVILFFLFVSLTSLAQTSEIQFTVDMTKPENHEYKVTLAAKVTPLAFIDLALPAWSPGYYQIMNFGKNLTTFEPKNAAGEPLRWVKFGTNTWRVYTDFSDAVKIDYGIMAARSFVATAYLDSTRAFIKPAALFLYPVNQLNTPVTVHLLPKSGWNTVATGLDGKNFTYKAPNYDILYDSPLLVGDLQELPAFTVKGKNHRFIGYNMGDFDGDLLMKDLQKLITVATDLIGDIPYNHYTFIGIGPGQGGIEQLNSTAVSFTGESVTGSGRSRTLSFLTHEYFHHFNVKRIRPVELGPFDYSMPNRTNLLWVAEGLTVYYEDIIMNRAGLLTRENMLKGWSNKIGNLQKNAGRLNQTLAESSANTWEDGPFGKKGETVSYYEKGPVVGMLLDLSIRTATDNKKSLNDVMRLLYNDYYKKQNRGFKDDEVLKACEKVAGVKLNNLFEYIYSTKELDYKTVFNKAGLEIDNNHVLSIGSNLTPTQKSIINDLFR